MIRAVAYRLAGPLAVILLSAGVCLRFYGDILRDPGAFLFGAEGDGLKNYFTVAWQTVHGVDRHFSGMLHPYGDHLLFADGQPLLTSVMHWFGPGVEDGHHIIGAMNLLMIGSLVLCAVLVHLILRRSLVASWFAVPFAVLIAFLSPQLARFAGHYALGYAFFIPLLWYLLIRLRAGRAWPWAMLLAAVTLAFTFIQPYYLLISTVFIGAVSAMDAVLLFSGKRKTANLLPQISALLLPFVLFTGCMALADPYADRPTAPYGLLSYVASFQSVFIPVMEPFKSLFTSYFFRLFVPAHWEGYAYVGLVPALCGAAALVTLVLNRRWRGLAMPVLPDALRAVWLPAFIVLLFSMAFFHHLGLSWLGEHFSAIRQFRSLGRMAWVFYYVFSVWAVVYLYRVFRVMRGVHGGRLRFHAWLLIVLSLGWWTLDAIVNIKAVKEQMIANPHGRDMFGTSFADMLAAHGIDPGGFQAILPLPFELIGSEKLELGLMSPATPVAMQASFSTGIPMVNGVMSRTSLAVTGSVAQWVAHPLMPQSVTHDLPDHRDLLVIAVGDGLTEGERFAISNATLLFANDAYSLYRLSPDDWEKARSDIREATLTDTSAMPSFFLREKEIAVPVDGLLLDTTLAAGDHEFSLWLAIDPSTTSLPVLEWQVGDAMESRRCGFNAEVWEGWLRVARHLHLEREEKVRFLLRSQGATVSRVLLRNANTHVRTASDGVTYYDNFPLQGLKD